MAPKCTIQLDHLQVKWFVGWCVWKFQVMGQIENDSTDDRSLIRVNLWKVFDLTVTPCLLPVVHTFLWQLLLVIRYILIFSMHFYYINYISLINKFLQMWQFTF